MMKLFILLAFGIRLTPDVCAQHLMQVSPQRVFVNNFAPGSAAPAQAAQPQFRIVQTFNGPFRILANPGENTNDGGPPSPSGSMETVAFRPVAGQPLATHHFNTGPQNPFSQHRPVLTTFRNSDTAQQGLQGPSHQVFQGPPHHIFQGPPHQVLQGPPHHGPQRLSHQVLHRPSQLGLQGPSHQGIQGPQDRRPPALQFPNAPFPPAFAPFQNPGLQNRNQPFNGNAFQQQQVQLFRQTQAPNGFFANPFPSTTQTHFPFHASAPTLPVRFTTSPHPRSPNVQGHGFLPNSETPTPPTIFQGPIQQNFQKPQGFFSEIPSSSEHFAPPQGPLGPPRFQTTTARFLDENPSRQHFQLQQQHGPSHGLPQEPPFTESPSGFIIPQHHQSFIPQVSTEFQDLFSTTQPGLGLSPQSGEDPQNQNFPDSFVESFPDSGLTGSREQFFKHGSNFPSAVEFPRAPITFFGQGFTGFPDPPSQDPTFNSQEFVNEGTSSEIPPRSISPNTELDKLKLNSQEIQPMSFQTNESPAPAHVLQNQFTSDELKPEVIKVTDDDRTLLQSRPTTANLPQFTSTTSFPNEAPTPQQNENFREHSGTLTSAHEDPSTTAINGETFSDTDSRVPTQTTTPDVHDQQEISLETPTQRTTSPMTPSPIFSEAPSDSSTEEPAAERQSTLVPNRKPQSPSFVAILNKLQQPPAREDQLQRPQSSRGSVKHSTLPLRRVTRIRRIRTTTRRPTQTADPLQELQTEQQRDSPQVVRDEFHRIPSSPPVVGSDAKSCDPSSCQLPNCFCGGNQQIPGGLKPSEVPQMILLTFDDSVNEINYDFYSSLLNEGRNNPNGCPISGTFYVSHEWTDYGKIQTLYALGHEIASHSITHSDGASFTKQRWDKEISGQKRILSALGRVRLDDIKGMRAPFLQGGGNKQFAMLYEANFTYDSSIPANLNSPPTWPYTLDYRMPHDCGIPPCPNKAFPGVWEVPMVMWEDLNGGKCAMADACHNPSDARGVYDMLVKNFKRHYTTNRAPFGMFYHYAWFTHPHQQEGFLAFIDALLRLPDVYFVTNSQMLEWMKKPTPLSRVKDFKHWQCKSFLADTCSAPKRCTYRFKGDERQFPTCQPCPEKYPWLESYDSLRVVV